MAVQVPGAFIAVRVAGINSINTIGLEYWSEGCAHIDFSLLQVGIVIFTLGIGGVMKDHDFPILVSAGLEVCGQPVFHGLSKVIIGIG